MWSYLGLAVLLAVIVLLALWRLGGRAGGRPAAGRRVPNSSYDTLRSLQAPRSPLARWRIQYVDQEGRRTTRVIRVVEFKPSLLAVDAWCELRGTGRRFFLSAIESAIDMQTGQRVDLDAWRQAQQRRQPPSSRAA